MYGKTDCPQKSVVSRDCCRTSGDRRAAPPGSAARPKMNGKPQLSRSPIFRLTAARQGPLPPLAADAACRGREGDPGRPQGGRSAAAGADITPATGRGRFAPTPMRHVAGEVQPNSRDIFRVPAQRGVRGGRRPAARAGQKPRCTEGHRLNTTRTLYLFQSCNTLKKRAAERRIKTFRRPCCCLFGDISGLRE